MTISLMHYFTIKNIAESSPSDDKTNVFLKNTHDTFLLGIVLKIGIVYFLVIVFTAADAIIAYKKYKFAKKTSHENNLKELEKAMSGNETLVFKSGKFLFYY